MYREFELQDGTFVVYREARGGSIEIQAWDADDQPLPESQAIIDAVFRDLESRLYFKENA